MRFKLIRKIKNAKPRKKVIVVWCIISIIGGFLSVHNGIQATHQLTLDFKHQLNADGLSACIIADAKSDDRYEVTGIQMDDHVRVFNNHIEEQVECNGLYRFVVYYLDKSSSSYQTDEELTEEFTYELTELSTNVNEIQDTKNIPASYSTQTVINVTTGVGYSTLQEAMDEMTQDAVLKLVADITLFDSLRYSKDYQVTLKSEGNHKILRDISFTNGNMIVIEKGTFVLGDNTQSSLIIDGHKSEVTATAGGVLVNTDAVFLMNKSAQIINCKAKDGYGAGVLNKGKFIMNDGLISGNEIPNSSGHNGGGISNFANASLIVHNGTISNNIAYLGGGIFNYGQAVMNNGIVSGNTATGGSGIGNATSGANFEFNGGNIDANKKGSYTQGIGVWNSQEATFKMTNGKITHHEGPVWGAGVFNDANFEMLGGEIAYNIGWYGGAVSNQANGVFTMSGGRIFDNLAKESGTAQSPSDGSAICNSGKIQLSGEADIAITDSIYTSNENIFITDSLTKGAFVLYPSRMRNSDAHYTSDTVLVKGTSTYNIQENDASRFHVFGYESPSYIKEKQYFTKIDSLHNQIISQENGITLQKNGIITSFSDLQSAMNSVDVGEHAIITLHNDLFINEKIQVSGNILLQADSGVTIHRDIHNHNYHLLDNRYQFPIFQVTEKGNLTLGENIVIDGETLGDKAESLIMNDGELYLINGTSIKNSYALEGSALINNGYLFLEDCEFKDNVSKNKGAIINNGTLNISNKIAIKQTNSNKNCLYLSNNSVVYIQNHLDNLTYIDLYLEDTSIGSKIIESKNSYIITEKDISRIHILNENVYSALKDNALIIIQKNLMNNEKKILSFSIQNKYALIDEENSTIQLVMPYGTDLTNLKPKFVLSQGANAYVLKQIQTSEKSICDFTNNVIYQIIAEDGSERLYTVIITVEDKILDQDKDNGSHHSPNSDLSQNKEPDMTYQPSNEDMSQINQSQITTDDITQLTLYMILFGLSLVGLCVIYHHRKRIE